MLSDTAPRCDFETAYAIDMIIFVSPVYAGDPDILSSIYNYVCAVHDDISWNTYVYIVDQSENNYMSISGVIERMYIDHAVQACIMVGEDMAEKNNVFHTSINNMCQQALPFWQACGGKVSPLCAQKVTVSMNTIRVPTSLIYPNFNDTYETKKYQIINAFNKFCTNRKATYGNDVVALYDTAFHEEDYFGDIFREELHHIGTATLLEDPLQSTVDNIVNGEYKLVIAAGHANPRAVHVSSASPSLFEYTPHGENVNTPFLLLSGCLTSGWYTETEDDCLYQPPSNRNGWLGHNIFDNVSTRVILAGFPIGGYGKNTEFVGSGCLRKMSGGQTIAEAMSGIETWGSNCTMFGDPTFHY